MAPFICRTSIADVYPSKQVRRQIHFGIGYVLLAFLIFVSSHEANAAGFGCLQAAFHSLIKKRDPGLQAPPAVRLQIQELKQELLDLSRREHYYGHEICLTRNVCHGASLYLKRVMKDKGIDSTIVTFEAKKTGGFEHSYLIVPNYFGPNSPLIIDPTIKQFMPVQYHKKVHDIFVGSKDELQQFIRKYRITGIGGSRTAERSFELYLQATTTGRFD